MRGTDVDLALRNLLSNWGQGQALVLFTGLAPHRVWLTEGLQEMFVELGQQLSLPRWGRRGEKLLLALPPAIGWVTFA